MKFLCDRSRLEAALAPILPAIPTKDSPKPALRSLHIRAEADALVLQGSNMELSIEVRVDSVKVEQTGSRLVPARRFFALVHEVPDATVKVGVEGSKLELPTSSGKFEVVTASADDFPDLEFDHDGATLEIPVELLKEHWSATEFACAREASRYSMNGILCQAKEGKFTTVATDGRRLALMSSELENPDPISDSKEGWQALLPHKSLAAAVRAVDSLSSETVRVRVGETSVSFEVPDARVSITRISGAFPDYDAVIPRGGKNTVEFNRVLLGANLRRATVLTEELNPAVKITVEGGQARFESEASGVGAAETTMDVELSGPGGHIIFNPNYITEVIKATDQDLIRFEFDDANAPGKFTLGEQYVYVLMPITGV